MKFEPLSGRELELESNSKAYEYKRRGKRDSEKIGLQKY